MRIQSIIIDGFRSFTEKSVAELPESNGVFLVKGKNLAEPSLGANGAGKSTVWDALCWCLYGKTARGIGAGHVEAWAGSGRSEVSVLLTTDRGRSTVARTRGPITLQVDGREVDQSVVDDLVGMSYERFLHVALMGQFGTLFPDLKPTARLDLISDALELDLWSRAAQTASGEAKALDGKLRKLEADLSGLESKQSLAKDQLESAEGRLAGWAESRERDLADAEAEHEACLDNLSRKSDLHDEQLGKLTKAELRHSEAEGRLARAQEEVDQQAKDERQKEDRRREAKQDLKSVKDRVAEVDAIAGGDCPLCEQEVPKSQLDSMLDLLDERVAKYSRLYEDACDAAEQSDKELHRLKDVVEELSEDHDKAAAFLRRTKESVRDSKSELERAERKVERAAEEIERISGETNPHQESVEDLSALLGKLAEDVAGCAEKLREMASRHEATKPWPKLFKELRLWVVEQALDELAIYVNSGLSELGLKGWAMHFSVEKTTKSGNVSRGFDITVRSPTSPEGVPWEAWSGGETQRLRVACAVGFANLLRSRMPSAPEFEVWDEPTAHLNQEGVQDLIAYMQGRAEDRQVWIVDHRSLESGAFAGTLTVTKDEKGSTLLYAHS